MKAIARHRKAWPVLGLLAMATAPACAQQATVQGVQPAAAAGTSPSLENAPEPTKQPSVQIVPRLRVTETFTDNVSLSTVRQSDAVTRISPGVHASSRGGRVQGVLDYSLSGLVYARGTRGNDLLNALSADGSAEVVERMAYVDALASITQQAINPLGTQSTDDQLGRSNRTEVRTLQLAPRLQGRLGDNMEWTARGTHSTTHSSATALSSSSISQAHVQLGNSAAPTIVGWSLQGSRTLRSFSQGRTTENDILRGVLDYHFNPEFSTGVIGGYEATDISSQGRDGRATYGWRMNWVPSPITRLNAEHERRFFGNAYSINFTHRLPTAALTYNASRALSNGVGQPVLVDVGTLREVVDRRLSSSEPDPARRALLVDDYLSRNNLNPDAQVLQPFLTAAVTAQRSQRLSLAWLGKRDTLTLTVQQTNSQRVDTVVQTSDVFSTNAVIRQRGYSLTFAHKLTPLSTVTFGYLQSRNSGSGVQTELRSATAQWSTELGPRTTFSLLGRRARFKSTEQPYNESALVGTFGMTF